MFNDWQGLLIFLTSCNGDTSRARCMLVVLKLSLNCSRNCRSIGGDDTVSNVEFVFLSATMFVER